MKRDLVLAVGLLMGGLVISADAASNIRLDISTFQGVTGATGTTSRISPV